MILFGGEFFDGQTTLVYQDLYRYNIQVRSRHDKNELKKKKEININEN